MDTKTNQMIYVQTANYCGAYELTENMYRSYIRIIGKYGTKAVILWELAV